MCLVQEPAETHMMSGELYSYDLSFGVQAGDVRCIWDVQRYAGLASRQAVLR